MPDISRPTDAFQVSSTIPNFPAPSTPLLPAPRSYVLPVVISLLVVGLVGAGGYFMVSKTASPSTIAVVDSVSPTPIASPVIIDPVFETITKITAPAIWSSTVESSILDAEGKEVTGILIATPPVEKDSAEYLPLLGSDSPLISEHGWSQVSVESGTDSDLVIYQKGNQKLYVRYQDGAYMALLSESL